MIRKTILLLAVLLFQAATAHADTIKDALNHKYKNQVLALRSPFTSGEQEFDSAGQPLNARPTGPWLLYGGIYVERLSLSSDTLRLEGPRAAPTTEKKNGKTMLVRFSKSQRIEIHLGQPLNSIDDADAVMGRVFFLGADAAEHFKPEFRRADDNTPVTEIFRVSQPEFRRAGVNAPLSSDKNNKVLPPRPTHTPEPKFSQQAHHAKYQGTVVLNIVVDKTGKVSRIRLERPLGLGLDENAMEGVKKWRFAPGTRNGEPVAVAMNIEISFNLY